MEGTIEKMGTSNRGGGEEKREREEGEERE